MEREQAGLGALGIRVREVDGLTEGVVWVRSHRLVLVDRCMTHEERREALSAVLIAAA